jgi:hypothetical protein
LTRVVNASSAESSGDQHEAILARNRLLVLLTFSSGPVHAICFLGLGKVFTASPLRRGWLAMLGSSRV